MTDPHPQPDDLPRGPVDDALENLVNQFARPLECLRELVQNAIDAGSPRVDVTVRWERETDLEGVLAIEVRDFGEGMDERLIDDKLTRMFASSKEDDLTKIGRFGIGFTSIFAIDPALVQVRTGRHGESWELVFHPDRSFTKMPNATPFRGTRVTLFRRMAAAERPRWVRECREVLEFWCAHSDVPVFFQDAGDGAAGARSPASPDTQSPDPFAAFAAPTPPPPASQISTPIELDCALVHRVDEPGFALVVGYGDTPQFGWYNGGLTLLSTRSPDCLGALANRLGHLRFKLKSNRLEHTLTRDNVIQDDHWQDVIVKLESAANTLRGVLLARHKADADQGRPLDPTLLWIAQEARAGGLGRRALEGIYLPTVTAKGPEVQPLHTLRAQRDREGVWPLLSGDRHLDQVLATAGISLIVDGPGVRALLATWPDEAPVVLRADACWQAPQLAPDATTQTPEAALLKRVGALCKRAGFEGGVQLGDFGRPTDRSSVRPIAWAGTLDGPLLRVGGAGRPSLWKRVQFRVRARRTVVIDRHHPLWLGWLHHSGRAPDLAAFAVAQLIVHDCEGLPSTRALEGAAAHALANR